jgi:hypothetical protein
LLLTLAVPNQLGYCLLEGHHLHNLAIEVDATFLEGSAGSSCGIVARYRDAGHLLLFEVSNEGMVRVRKKAENWTILQDWTPVSDARTGQADNRLRLHVSGPALIFYVNGQAAYGGVDTGDFDPGQIALAIRSGPDAQRVRVSFDNLKVWEIK